MDAILDVNIDPDAGSGNPFRRGSSGQQHNYTVNVGGPSGQANHVNFDDTPLAWIIYRIHVANRFLEPSHLVAQQPSLPSSSAFRIHPSKRCQPTS